MSTVPMGASLQDTWNELWEKFRAKPAVWDIEQPDHNLVKYLTSLDQMPRLALEVGCSSGVNAVWMAQQGISVVAVDIAPRALELAQARAIKSGVSVDFKQINFLEDVSNLGKFDFVFDRAVAPFRNLADRDQFSANVASRMLPDAKWLSVSISNENGSHPEYYDPPRRSILDVVSAIDSYLQILSVDATILERNDDWRMPAWVTLSQIRKHAATRTIF